jgi:hypothetical protein
MAQLTYVYTTMQGRHGKMPLSFCKMLAKSYWNYTSYRWWFAKVNICKDATSL